MKKSFEITRNKLVIKEIEKKLKSYVENHKESLNKIENNFEAKYYFENLKEIQSINKLLSIIDFNKMELNNCLDKNNYCHYKNIKDYDYDLFEKLSKSQELNRYEKYYLDKKYAQLTYTCWDIGSKVEALIKERIEAIQNEGLEKPLIEKDRLFKVKKEYKMDKLYYNILSYCKELYPIKESTLRNHLNNENWEKATKYVERKKVEHKGYGNLHKLDILIKKIEAYKQQFESQKWGWFSKDRTSIIWSNELK